MQGQTVTGRTSVQAPTIAAGVDVRIRQAVLGTGMTLREFSAHMAATRKDIKGWSYSNLAEFGRGLRPRVEHLEAIADETGAPRWFLLGGWQAAPSPTPGELQILSKLVDIERLVDPQIPGR